MKLAMLVDGPLRLERVGRDQVEHGPGPLEEPLEDGVRALAERQRVELVERAEELAQLGARHRRGIDRLVLGPVLAPLVDDVDLDLPRRDDRP